MNEFKVGDTLVALMNTTYLTKGQQYVVRKLCGDDGVYLEDTEDCWFFNSKFKLLKTEPEFCMKENDWFIRPNNEQEWKVAVEFVKSKGFSFQYDTHYEAGLVITNRCTYGAVLYGGLYKVIRSKYTKGKEEIKLSYKTTLDKVEYPEVKSAQQLEIEKIEAEMTKLEAETRKLADRLNELKVQ